MAQCLLPCLCEAERYAPEHPAPALPHLLSHACVEALHKALRFQQVRDGPGTLKSHSSSSSGGSRGDCRSGRRLKDQQHGIWLKRCTGRLYDLQFFATIQAQLHCGAGHGQHLMWDWLEIRQNHHQQDGTAADSVLLQCGTGATGCDMCCNRRDPNILCYMSSSVLVGVGGGARAHAAAHLMAQQV
jgi:hypothetical protein